MTNLDLLETFTIDDPFGMLLMVLAIAILMFCWNYKG